MGSDKSVFTVEIKNYTRKSVSWINAGADLVGIVSVDSVNEIEPYWIENDQAYTARPSDYMEGGQSVILLGYHAWDDTSEAIIRKGDKLEAFSYSRVYYNTEKVVKYLENKVYKAKIADGLPLKKIAILTGFGSYGKNSLNINPEYGPWVRLNAIITDAEMDVDEEFKADLCKDCDLCVKACPTGALTPYVIDPSLCMASLSEEEWLGIFSGKSKFEDYRQVENGNALFKSHSRKLTENSYLWCMTCQKACPYGRVARGLDQY